MYRVNGCMGDFWDGRPIQVVMALLCPDDAQVTTAAVFCWEGVNKSFLN